MRQHIVMPAEEFQPARWEGSRGEAWVLLQALLGLLYLLAPRRGPAWPAPLRRAARIAGLPPLLAGLLVLAAGARALGRDLTPLPKPGREARLIVDGPYRYLRHPIYTGLSLSALGAALATAHPLRLALTPLIAAFFAAKARREEAWLRRRFAGDYAAYARRVPRFLPRGR